MVTLPHSNAEVVLPQGTVRYRDEGTGPTLVFVHGLLVNSELWRGVISVLAGQFRCIALDLPLGAHTVALHDDVDLTPAGVAQLIAQFLIALDLHDVTLVGNDTGGAMCQLTIVDHPERISGLVLMNCDAFEAFFPPLIMPFVYGARIFGDRFADFLAWTFRSYRARRMLIWTVSMRYAEDAVLDAYFAALLSGDRGIRHDVTKFLKGVSNRYTVEAAKKFQNFQHPVLIVWGKSDFLFPRWIGRRLQERFPHARLEFIARSRAFVPEDQPVVLAQKIAGFVGESSEFRPDGRERSQSTSRSAGGSASTTSATTEKE